jgi:hypothetical protein
MTFWNRKPGEDLTKEESENVAKDHHWEIKIRNKS